MKRLITLLTLLLMSAGTSYGAEHVLSPDVNFGAKGKAETEVLNFSQWDHAFLKFNLSDLANAPSQATLRLYFHGNNSLNTVIWPASNDAWDTASGPPPVQGHSWLGTTALASTSLEPKAYTDIDVTEFIQQQYAADEGASFEISSDNGGWRAIGALNSNHPPQLVIEVLEGTSPPPPAPTPEPPQSPEPPESPPAQPPVAVIDTTTLSGNAPLTVSLDGSQSSDADGQITTYLWQINGNTVSHQASMEVTLDSGDHIITLEVTDSQGLRDSRQITISVSAPPPPPVPTPEPPEEPDEATSFALFPTDDSGAGSTATTTSLYASQWDHAFFRFALPDTSSRVIQATLRLYMERDTPLTSRLWVASSTDWTESSGAPTATGYGWTGGQLLSEKHHSSAAYIDFDASTYIAQQLASQAAAASFELSNDQSGWQKIASRESQHPPTLLIVMEGGADSPLPPEPSPPIASFTHNRVGDLYSHQIAFNAAAANDPAGSTLSYQWDFGDGYIGNGVTTDHEFSVAGEYNVVLTVTNTTGQTGSYSSTVTINPAPTVENTPPLAVIDIQQDGDNITFDASRSSDTDGEIESYQWDFGDGSNSESGSVPTTTHNYAPGTYTATLKLRDNTGSEAQASITLTVAAPPLPPQLPDPDTDSDTPENPGEQPLLILSPTDDAGAGGKPTSNSLNLSFWDHAFLRFELPGQSRSVEQAFLRIHYKGSTPLNTLLWANQELWSESSGLPSAGGFSWGNGQLLAEISADAGYQEIDVTQLINSRWPVDQFLGFELSSDQGGWRAFSSRESDNPPQLIIKLATDDGDPAPSPGGDSTPPPSPEANTKRIVAIGNSITQASAITQSFRYPLWKKLVEGGYNFDFVGSQSSNEGGNPTWPNYLGKQFDQDHEGHWGWRADQIAQQLPQWLSLYDADIALIHIGSNDLIQGQSVSSSLNDIRQIIAELRQNNPGITVLLANLIPADTRHPLIDGTIIQSYHSLNNGIQNLAIELNQPGSAVVLVDQAGAFDPVTQTVDGIHPNTSGEETMAQRWFDAITPYL